MAHLTIGNAMYSDNLGTAGRSQTLVAWGSLDDTHMDGTMDGRLLDMSGCLDAPQRVPAGSTKKWLSDTSYVSSSHVNR